MLLFLARAIQICLFYFHIRVGSFSGLACKIALCFHKSETLSAGKKPARDASFFGRWDSANQPTSSAVPLCEQVGPGKCRSWSSSHSQMLSFPKCCRPQLFSLLGNLPTVSAAWAVMTQIDVTLFLKHAAAGLSMKGLFIPFWKAMRVLYNLLRFLLCKLKLTTLIEALIWQPFRKDRRPLWHVLFLQHDKCYSIVFRRGETNFWQRNKTK